MVLEDAATAKEVQDLARHATPQLTMNVYGRVREESLAQTVEKVAGRVLSEEKYVPSMYRQAIGAEPENATAIDNKQLRLKSRGGAEGNRTPDLLNAIQALSQLSYSPTSNESTYCRPKRQEIVDACTAENQLTTTPRLSSAAA